MTGDERAAAERLAPARAPSRRLLFSAGFRWRIAGCILLAAVAGFVAWFFGLDPEHAIGLAAIILAAGACATVLGEQAGVGWLPDPVLPRDGARRDVSQLGWALHTRGGGVAPEAVRRLRSVTASALELHGLDLDNPADAPEIARLLGPDTVRLLRRGTAESPKPATFEAIVTSLARIAEAPIGPVDPVGDGGDHHTVGRAEPHAASTASTAPTAPTALTPPQEPHP
ncbi:hypothetical protein [Leifsonia sp. Le1]|uniref:hypothetical protein n=1 Tax=Leifsonia sp. Le1 TaxID=3404918 RepID=UPI003EBA15D4